MSVYTYCEACKLINEFIDKYHSEIKETSSCGLSTYNGYIEGESRRVDTNFATITIKILYCDFPSTWYFEQTDKGNAKIKSIQFSIAPKHKNAEYKTFYAEDDELIRVIYPFIIREVERAKDTFNKEIEEKEKAEKEKRYNEFLRLKQEFEPKGK